MARSRGGGRADRERLLHMALLQTRRGARPEQVVDRLISKGMDPGEARREAAALREEYTSGLRVSGLRNLGVGALLLVVGIAGSLLGSGHSGERTRIVLYYGAILAGLTEASLGVGQCLKFRRMKRDEKGTG